MIFQRLFSAIRPQAIGESESLVDTRRSGISHPISAGIFAGGIFLLDTVAPADIAVAVLYSAIVLLSIGFPWRYAIVVTGAACSLLTILSYLLNHGDSYGGAVLADGLVSLAAIGVTTFLAVRIRGGAAALSEQAKALEQANTELAHATRVTTLGQLSTSITHELKQPLAAIATNGDVCVRYLNTEPPDVQEVRAAVTRIIGDVHRTSQIINQLRALIKKSDPKTERVDINSLVEETLLLLGREISRHRISLRLSLAPELPTVIGDRIQLQQVILNLVVNAIESMAEISDRPRELIIRSSNVDPAQLIVAVQDAGTGIDDANAGELFKAFYTSKSEGLGMGLSICRSIVEAHDGTLSASSNDGPGATFQFALPAEGGSKARSSFLRRAALLKS
jgi:signal transduction histidine kinase